MRSRVPCPPGGGDPLVLDANYPPKMGGRGEGGGGLGGAWGGGAPGGSVGGGGVQVGRIGGGGGAQAPLTSPCPPSNHTITINLTLTFAAS